MIGKELLSKACRYDVKELLISAAFHECMGYSSASKVLLFKRFKAHWGLIDVMQYMLRIEEQTTVSIFSHKMENILNFAEV